MNTKELEDLIGKTQPNICQIVVLKNGGEVFAGNWNGYKRDDCVHVMSVTKSIVSLLTGIALDRGLIKGVDDKVLDYFPDYRVKRGEKTAQHVTIRHLLTMRAPYKCKGDPWSKVCASGNWTKTSLDLLGGRKGLTDEFNYQTVCLHVLGGILYRASGMKTVDFANEWLFSPLGIGERVDFHAASAAEHKAFTMEKAPKGNVWFADPDGLGTPGYGLCMSAQDMAKIGRMCLNGGKHGGRRIVSESWIKDMTVPGKVEDPRFRGMQYGYLWWIIHPEKNIYAALGNSGNVLYVNPSSNTVVAVASCFKPTVFDRVDFIEGVLLPELGC